MTRHSNRRPEPSKTEKLQLAAAALRGMLSGTFNAIVAWVLDTID